VKEWLADLQWNTREVLTYGQGLGRGYFHITTK
jgi:hypothetical protein